MEIEILKENIFNIFSEKKHSLLDRYGFLKNDWRKANFKKTKKGNTLLIETGKFTLNFKDGKISSLTCRNKKNGKVLLRGKFYTKQGQYIAEFDIDKNEKFVGLGDQTREKIEHRGTFADMWIKNVDSYIPIPFLMSSKNYGIFVNTTYRHYWNIGKSNPDKLYIILPEGNFNIYIFGGDSFYELLSSYTDLTGKSCFPPKWSFGLWFICRTQANDFEVISDALNFRDRKIPCDVIGLEPGWMEKFYDYSTEKKWHPEKFPIPPYAPNGPHTFISALKRMGFKIELWLCNDYDLIYEEERKTGNEITEKKAEIIFSEDDKEKDTHFTEPVRMDKITKIKESWFEHLKKFIDQGIDFFKQDGALQVCEHPDRLWGSFLTDKEVHNLYPLLYSRQMFEGIKDHTGKRPCCFTPAGWAGLQKYTGTWTGDTGGGEKTLVASLNLAFSGHSLITCDMEVTTREGIHYGFLLPWAQVNSWNYFRHPWLLGDELFPVFLDYARLRYQLIPYIYTYAYNSHKTGIPIIRPLPLEFPEDKNTYNILNEYFLGRELLITAFSKEIYIPEGKYLDLWENKVYKGKNKFKYNPPENRGGGLFLRENSILPLGPVIQYTEEKTDKGFTVLIFISKGEKAEFSLYDDDGISFNYQKGNFLTYNFSAEYRGGNLIINLPEKLKIENIIVYLEKKPEKIIQKGNEVNSILFKQV